MTQEPKLLFPGSTEGLDDVIQSLLDKTPQPQGTSPNTNVNNPENYIILPEKSHGSYSYPELLIASDRTHQNNNWANANAALQQEGSFMLTLRQYVDFLNLLKSGNVYNGKGVKLDNRRVDAILDDILRVRNPYRAEWLDAKFSTSGQSWNITYHKIRTDGTIEEVTEPLQDCLREDRAPGIDLNHWLKNAAYQGLPPSSNPQGNLYYWEPRNGYVAGFGADSSWASFSCGGVPRSSGAGLGVRAAKIKR